MEKTNLRWVHSGRSRGNSDINRGKDSNFGYGFNSVRFNDGEKFKDGTIREDQTNFSSKGFF